MATDRADDHALGSPGAAVGSDDWDARYGASDQIWSGQPNGALVAEIGDVAPGRALDVGCGEGADAVWLARKGWQVTALDVSRVALDRARTAAHTCGVEVDWLHAGLLDAPLAEASFDLVTAQYPALRRTEDSEAVRVLLGAVAPGGTLLFVHHADVDQQHASAHGCDLADYVGREDVVAGLTDAWDVLVDERRPRQVSAGAGAHHTHDLVLRLRRHD